ncbi:WD-40 repeat-containing protein [Flammula alnicola]|nr:WD-40 repeat-containing protein [Flammula alnicola]
MATFDTVLPADSLEFCPTANFQDIFVCGTYKLVDQQQSSELEAIPISEAESSSRVTQTRRGHCLVFQVTPDPDGGLPFQRIQSFDLPAILDMKWCHRSSTAPPVLGIADSEGNITIHEWREQSLIQIDSVRCAPSDTLVLSLDWSNRRSGGTELGSLVASLSSGSLCILSPTERASLSITETWHAHDYAPWVAAWNYWDTNIIYSGGDDLKLKSWDVRQGFTHPTFVNKRFDAGVTSIQSHPHVEHLLAVGSYDDTVKLFDGRKLSSPITEVDVGGGAWRVKWHPSETRKHDLLVACMHDGFKVVRFGSASDDIDTSDGATFSDTPQVIKRNDDHESMAYGADWSYAPPLVNRETLIGGCSFYDHKMSLWSA